MGLKVVGSMAQLPPQVTHTVLTSRNSLLNSFFPQTLTEIRIMCVHSPSPLSLKTSKKSHALNLDRPRQCAQQSMERGGGKIK